MTELAERRPQGKGGKFHTLWLSKWEKKMKRISCVSPGQPTQKSKTSTREAKPEVIRENIQGYLYDPEAWTVLVLFLNKH